MICFTVMDFDMMTTNDFEGEAFLRVTQVAGVDGTGNILNVTPMELPLLQPKEKSMYKKTMKERKQKDNEWRTSSTFSFFIIGRFS